MKTLFLLPKKTSSRKIPPEAFKDLFDEGFGIGNFKGAFFAALLLLFFILLILLGSFLKFPTILLSSFVFLPLVSRALGWKEMWKRLNLNQVDCARIFLRKFVFTLVIVMAGFELIALSTGYVVKRYSIQIKERSEVIGNNSYLKENHGVNKNDL